MAAFVRDVAADLKAACEESPIFDYLIRVQVRGDLMLDELILSADEDAFRQEWDVENRLARVTDLISGAVTEMVYDGDGARVLPSTPTTPGAPPPARTSR